MISRRESMVFWESKMKNKIIISLMIGIFAVLVFGSCVFALTVDSNYQTVYAGDSTRVTLTVKNTENFDIQDVSVALSMNGLPFSIEGSSEKDVDEIEEDDKESFIFNLNANGDAKPGSYEIPYVIKYYNVNGTVLSPKTGTVGIRVSAKTELDFAINAENNIIDEKGKLNLDIINRGAGDLKSVSVEIMPSGFDLLSEKKVYVGSVAAYDSERVSFDVIYRSNSPTFSAKVVLKDFDNKDQEQIVTLPVSVYSRERATQLGLLNQGGGLLWIWIIVILVVAFIVWRIVRRRKKKKSSTEKF